MDSLVSSVIAVVGTLLGAVVAGLLQHRVSRVDRQEAQDQALRRERLSAVTSLVAALSEHRRAMWVREDLRLSGAPSDAYAEARAQSHTTRAAITAPLTAVKILAPSLSEAAEHAARACYSLRAVADEDVLTARREAAIAASDRLVNAAAALI
ncbi:protein kilB [Streptomyces sp. NPDC048665]|uniref:protein kilB n=1 Tax=Streptomyces sp. NPDC048665 TaxID=3155490 RepID=UPI00344429B1